MPDQAGDRRPSVAATIEADMDGRPDSLRWDPLHRQSIFGGRTPGSASGASFWRRAPPRRSRPGQNSFRRSISRSASRRTSARGHDDGNGDKDEGEEAPVFVPPLIAEVKPEPGVPPIPWVPFAVINCVVFAEFLISGVAGPFYFDMIYDLEPGLDDSAAATWAGVIAAGFFFAQFLTSLLWSALADRFGRRNVLFASALGSTISVVLYGVSPSLQFALAMRLTQGFFNGAVGVAKGGVRDLTVPANESQAFAVLGFWWGMGGIVGPILGGLLEHPVDKYPFLFDHIPVLKTYPYLLPCLAAGACSFVGAVLAVFTGYNGGVRGEEFPPLPEHEQETGQAESTTETGLPSPLRPSSYAPSDNSMLTVTHTAPRPRGLSTTTYGSHGLRPGYQGSILSRTSLRRQAVVSALNPMRSSFQPEPPALGGNENVRGAGNNELPLAAQADAPSALPAPRLSFVQRFVLANDDAVHTLSDLWVASAINGEDALDTDVFLDEDEEEQEVQGEDNPTDRNADEPDSSVVESETEFLPNVDEAQEETGLLHPHMQDSSSSATGRHSPRPHAPALTSSEDNAPESSGVAAFSASGMLRNRRASNMSTTPRIPSLFRFSGLERPWSQVRVPSAARSGIGAPPVDDPAGGSSQVGGSGISFARTEIRGGGLTGTPNQGPGYGAITEARPKDPDVKVDSGAGADAETSNEEKTPSVFSVLPLVIIAHFAVVGLHSSTFDQVFLSFLVSPVENGGLGMTAAYYAELIAFMAFCQLGFQFYLYPWLGPPHGRLTHLGMLRLGLVLYLPTYTLFPVLRSLLSPWTEDGVMAAMVFLSGMRYLANICAYTAIAILMNALTPPHLVPLANGLAQTVSSAARFVGPLVGGVVWGVSVEGGPSAHPWPLNFHLGFWLVGLLGMSGFIQSWWIR